MLGAARHHTYELGSLVPTAQQAAPLAMEHSFQQKIAQSWLSLVYNGYEYEMGIHTQALWWACTERAQGPISRVSRSVSVVD